MDTVKRGEMLRQVRGNGTLVPEDIRWIPATTLGRVEQIRLHPGTAVKADSVILELSNPELDQELHEAELKVEAAEASLQNLRVQTQNDYLQQKATAASISADYNKAKMQAEMNDALAKAQLYSFRSRCAIHEREGHNRTSTRSNFCDAALRPHRFQSAIGATTDHEYSSEHRNGASCFRPNCFRPSCFGQSCFRQKHLDIQSSGVDRLSKG